MPRIRSIHPGLFTDEAFLEASPYARLLIVGIWCEAWDDGVLEWRPIRLKVRLFPADNVDVRALLEELEDLDVIRQFEHNGKPYAAIRNFRKWQRPRHPCNSGILPAHLETYVGEYTQQDKPRGQKAASPVDDEQDDDPADFPSPPVNLNNGTQIPANAVIDPVKEVPFPPNAGTDVVKAAPLPQNAGMDAVKGDALPQSAGIASQKGGREEGKKEGREEGKESKIHDASHHDDDATDGCAPSRDPPPGLDAREALWRDGLPILRRLTGKSDGQCRAALGRLLRDLADDCPRLMLILREAETLRPADPMAWLTRSVGNAGRPPPPRYESRRDAVARAWGFDKLPPIPDDPPTLDPTGNLL